MRLVSRNLLFRLGRQAVALAGLDLVLLNRRDVFAWYPNGKVKRVSPANGFFYQPCVHPRGTAAVYFGNTQSVMRIWKTDLQTMETKALTPPDYMAIEPSYSWDGERIVFAADQGCGQESIEARDLQLTKSLREHATGRLSRMHIYAMDTDGGRLRQVTSGDNFDHRPSLSPDGTQVVFISNRGGKIDLWVTGIGGRSELRCLHITEQGLTACRPWFGADARSIFFWAAEPGGTRERIFRFDMDKDSAEVLRNDDRGRTHGPFVDPDGRCLLAHSTRGGDFNIWEFPLDGGEPRSLHPPGVNRALHATRSRDGIITFDAPARPGAQLRRKSS